MLINNGSSSISFASANNFTELAGPRSLATGDFNEDGKADLATAKGDYLSIRTGNDDGTFNTPANYGAGTGFFSVVAGDFNNDDHVDLAASYGTTVSVYMGAGDGSFASAVNFTVGTSPVSVAIGDFNGNGKVGLATANTNSNNASVLLNNMLRITPSAGPNGSLVCDPLMVDPNGGSTCAVTPDTNYQIDSVTGCGGSLNGGTYTITNLTTDCTVTATFAQPQLSVSVTGSGSVTSSPSGIDCGSTCSANFNQGTNVTLTAADGSGYYFAEWGGDCSGTSYEASVSMTANKSCSATFVGATITSDYASPQTKGTTIEFTGEGLGPAWTFEYQFRLKEGTSAYVTVQAYSTDNTWDWDTSSVTPGSYTVQVQVRKYGSAVYQHAYATMSYVINWPPVSGVLVNPTFTAQGSGGSGNYEYRFRRYNGSTWDTMQDYSSTPTWTWDTTGFAPGMYNLQVQVRNAGSGSADVTYNWDYSINYDSLVTATLSASPASPQYAGTEIEFTATGSGGTGYYDYRFRLWTGSEWQTVQDYSSDNTYTWVTTGYSAGGYSLQVQVRRQYSTAAYEAVKILQYTLQ